MEESAPAVSKTFHSFPSREAQCLKGHQGSVLVVRFNTDGNYCVSGGSDKSIRLWNPSTGKHIKAYTGHGWEILDLAISSDNSKIGSCGGDRMVFLWDVASGRVIRKFRGHNSRVNAIRFNHPDCSVAITASYDKTVKIWDCKSNNQDPIQVLEESRDSVTSLCVSQFEITSGSVDGAIRVYDIRNGQLITDTLGQPVTSVSLSHDSNCVLVSSLDNSVRLIDKEGGEILSEYTGHKNSSIKIDSCFSGDDAYVYSGSEDHLVYVWDLVEAKVLAKLKGHSNAVCGLAFHPSENRLLSCSIDGTIRLWT